MRQTKNWKKLAFLGLIAVLTLLFSAAYADRTHPVLPKGNDPAPVRYTGETPIEKDGSALTVTLRVEGELVTGNTVTVYADAAGGDGQYEYVFYVLAHDPLDPAYTYHYPLHMSDDQKRAGNSFSFKLYEPGEIYVNAKVWDGSGKTGATGLWDNEYTVTGTNLVDEKIQQLAAGFMSQYDNDYDRALAAHDWLTANANYDGTYLIHGAFGVLFENKGVCESYGRAYRRIMNAMGIPAWYVRGQAGGGSHGWNKINLFGDWYVVDCTWDDPTGNADGMEYHLYFGLNDRIISLDHTQNTDVDYPACNSLEYNYYIRSGYITNWIDLFRTSLNSQLTGGNTAAELSVPGSVRFENGYYFAEVIPWYITEYWLSENIWQGTDGRYRLSAEYSESASTITVQVLEKIPDIAGSLEDAEISLEEGPFVYCGEEILPAVTVTLNGTVLTKGMNYTAKYENNIIAGTAKLTIAGIGGCEGTREVSFTITPRPVLVTANARTKTYGEADPELTYTAEGLVGQDALSGSLTRAAGENTGEYAIELGSLTAGENYTVTFTGAKLTVVPKELSVTAEALTKVYGETDPELTYTAEGLVGQDALSGSLTRAAGENVGEYAIEQGSLTGGENYTIRFTSAKLTITPKLIRVITEAKTKVYGSVNPELTYTAEGLVGKDVLTGSLTRAPGEDVGEYDIWQGSLTAGENYAISYTSAKLTITPKLIRVIADAWSKVYGDEDPELTWKAEGLVGKDVLTGSLTRALGEDAGEYDIWQGSLTAGKNYAISFISAKLTVTPKPIRVIADARSKVYGDVDPELTWTAEGLVGEDALTGSLTREEGDNVGEYAIRQGYLMGGRNYTIDFTGAKLTISPRPVLVTADARSKVYGDTDPELTWTAEGLLGQDTLTGSLIRMEGEDTGEYAITQGTLTVGENYMMSFIGAKLRIMPKSISVVANARSKVYGDADPELTWTVEDVGAEYNLTGTLIRAQGEDAGEYDIWQGSLTAGKNYAISFTSAKLTVLPKQLSVTADAKTKIYSSADPELTWTAEGLIGQDTLSGNLTRAEGENAGEYVIEQGSLTAGDNYVLSFTGAKLTVTPKELSVTADAQMKVYGSADPELTYTAEGLVGQDALSGSLTRDAGENAGEYAIKQGSLTAGGNYTILFTGAKLTVAPKELVITAHDQEKPVGGEDPELTYTADGLVGTDRLEGALTRREGEEAGEYAILQGSLSAGNNYTIVFRGAVLRIFVPRTDIGDAAFVLAQNRFVETGRAKEPGVKVICDGTELIPGRDFLTEYSRNVSAGTAVVTVTGTGDYEGSQQLEFEILPAGLSVCTLPGELTELRADALAGTAFLEIVLPDRPVVMEAGCLAGSGALQVTIPNAGTAADPGAFDGLEGITVVAPAELKIGGTAVAEFCAERGFWFEEPAD